VFLFLHFDLIGRFNLRLVTSSVRLYNTFCFDSYMCVCCLKTESHRFPRFRSAFSVLVATLSYFRIRSKYNNQWKSQCSLYIYITNKLNLVWAWIPYNYFLLSLLIPIWVFFLWFQIYIFFIRKLSFLLAHSFCSDRILIPPFYLLIVNY